MVAKTEVSLPESIDITLSVDEYKALTCSFLAVSVFCPPPPGIIRDSLASVASKAEQALIAFMEGGEA